MRWPTVYTCPFAPSTAYEARPLPSRLIPPHALLPGQAPPRRVVEEHDLRAAVVVHHPPVVEQVINDLGADTALLHAYPGVLGEFGGVHGLQCRKRGGSGSEPGN